jgi:hypothetical protein
MKICQKIITHASIFWFVSSVLQEAQAIRFSKNRLDENRWFFSYNIFTLPVANL